MRALKNVDGAGHGDREGALRVRRGIGGERERGEVGYRVRLRGREGSGDGNRVGNVEPGRRLDYLMPGSTKVRAQPPADKARCACDQDSHVWL